MHACFQFAARLLPVSKQLTGLSSIAVDVVLSPGASLAIAISAASSGSLPAIENSVR
jgi:hypothetical protein